VRVSLGEDATAELGERVKEAFLRALGVRPR
jgi:hypothetical protein